MSMNTDHMSVFEVRDKLVSAAMSYAASEYDLRSSLPAMHDDAQAEYHEEHLEEMARAYIAKVEQEKLRQEANRRRLAKGLPKLTAAEFVAAIADNPSSNIQ